MEKKALTWDEVKEKYPEQTFGEPDEYDDGYMFVKPVSEMTDDDRYVVSGWRIELTHSCDEWVIGNLEEAKAFQRNLSLAIKFIEDNQ